MGKRVLFSDNDRSEKKREQSFVPFLEAKKHFLIFYQKKCRFHIFTNKSLQFLLKKKQQLQNGQRLQQEKQINFDYEKIFVDVIFKMMPTDF